jgi:hypothetical protein
MIQPLPEYHAYGFANFLNASQRKHQASIDASRETTLGKGARL